MSVVVQLRGGLGNHLFQYAAGFSLARRLGEELLIDTALLPREEIMLGGVRRWTEQISGFEHGGSFVDTGGSSRQRRRVVQFLSGRERAFGDSPLPNSFPGRLYAHESRDDLDEFAALRSGARINAYCNSLRFFENDEEEIRRQVRTLVAPSLWYVDQAAQLEKEGAVAVHVRWGDYLNLKHVFGTVPPTYYRRALDLLARTDVDRPVWLFSDDPKGASEYLAGTVDVANVVVPPAESTALENLLLLSKASGLVGANSSFSWWSAFLSTTHRSVVFPRPLYAEGGPPEPKGWLQPDWIQIGRD